MHVDDERIHRRQLLRGSPDDDFDALVEGREIRFRDEHSHLNEHVLREVEAGHFAIDPDEALLRTIRRPGVFVEDVS